MRHGSLFSGIGGFDLASEWMGWDNVFHCEWNTFGQKVLNYYWPNSITYNDITKTDFTIHRGGIDIITGGFPCQPYSSAGKRLGKEDERHLWPEMLRAIREIQPTWVVGENVLGLVNWDGGLVFHEVQADLETQGYEVQPYVLPAASVNAPHRRDRVWFVAYSKSCADSRKSRKLSNEAKEENGGWIEPGTSSEQQVQLSTESSSLFGDVSDSELKGFLEYTNSSKISSKKGTLGGKRNKSSIESTTIYNKSNATDSNSEMLEYGNREGETFRRTIKKKRTKSSNGSREWEAFPTVSPICNGDDGLSDRLDSITFPKWRNESIKAGGNAIVPQVVYQIFKAIEQYNQLDKQLSI
jgi:DNA (cytosine-5)-methyltransferase 1